MANFILIHGSGGSPGDCFYPWLRQQLEKRGHAVYAPQLPKLKEQTLERWIKAFKPYGKHVNGNTILVARSLGPAFALRLLERANVKIKAAFLVAGFCSDIGLEEFRALIGSFIDPPFDWEKIRSNCARFFVYGSDNDRYVPYENVKELAQNLGTKPAMIKRADHFYMKKFPRLLADIKKFIY